MVRIPCRALKRRESAPYTAEKITDEAFMPDDLEHWSCYTTSPERSLEIFDYADVRSAMGDYKTYSSQPQVLRPMSSTLVP